MTRNPAAEAAKCIRADLKKAYPKVAFTVHSSTYSGGDNVNVYWTDGPTADAIKAIVDKYSAGTFNGMIDLYEYRDDQPAHPVSKYVFVERKMSDEKYASIRATIIRQYGIKDAPADMTHDWSIRVSEGTQTTLSEQVYRDWRDIDYTKEAA